MSARGRAVRPVALVAVATLALIVPGQAGAHAVLVGSDPADGSTLASSPQQIRLWFSEDVSASLSKATLSGARLGRVAGMSVTGESKRLVVSLPRLRRDAYLLHWHTVSEDDLHATGGSIAFKIGTSAGHVPVASGAARARAVPGPDKTEVALRWIDFAAIAGLIGALALATVCIPQAARRGATGLASARRRLAAMAAVSGAVALCTGAELLLEQARNLATFGTVLTTTTYGSSWIARELLIAVLLAVALMLTGRRAGALVGVFVVLASLALCVSLAFNSHSASARGQVSLATAALAFHLLAAALWAGGVCALALVLIGSWRRAHSDGSARLLLRSFSGLALLSVSVLALTGLYSAGVDVASTDSLITTLYGQTLVAKTALFIVVGLVGLTNSMLIRSGRDGGRLLGRGVRLEALLVAGVILLAAALASTAPARGTRVVAIRAATPAAASIRSAEAGDLLVSLAVKPNQPGLNFVTAGVFDTRRPAPAPIRAVEFSIGRGRSNAWVRATRVRGRYWQLAGSELHRAGTWSIAVRILRRGLPDQIVKMPWTLTRPPALAPSTRTVVSGRPLAPLLSPAAGAGVLVLTAALLVFVLRRKRALLPDHVRRGRDRLAPTT